MAGHLRHGTPGRWAGERGRCLLLGIGLLGLSCGALPASGQEPTTTATVTLTVVDEVTGAPLNDVVAVLGAARRPLLSDSLGKIVLEQVGTGVHALTLTRPGYEERRGRFTVDRDGGFRIGLRPVSTVRVHGVVLDRVTGRPVTGAEVDLVGVARRVTDDRGRFSFDEVPRGRYALNVDVLGRASHSDSLTLGPSEAVNVDVRLGQEPIPLEGIDVVVRPRSLGLERAGFYGRRDQIGAWGDFVTRDDIERSGSTRPADLLRMVAGSHIAYTSGGGLVMRMHRTGDAPALAAVPDCEPTVWVDGLRYRDPGDGYAVKSLDFLPTAVIEGIEVYVGLSTPLRFDPKGCGAVVFWTRGYR